MDRSALRSLGTLLPVLGVTWLFGILAVNEKADVFQYIFVIANSLQARFLLFCVKTTVQILYLFFSFSIKYTYCLGIFHIPFARAVEPKGKSICIKIR